MIELWYAPTPNGWKISIMLEECGLPYRIRPLLLHKGEQHQLAYAAISPTGKMPAITDLNPDEGSSPRMVFESGAILYYLAEKAKKLLPDGEEGRLATLSWLMWQVSALGPILGQHGYFRLYAEQKLPFAIAHFRREAERVYGVLDRQLARAGGYVAGADYTADIACFPWIMTHKAQGLSLDDYPQVRDWFARTRARPAVQRGLTAGRELFTEQGGLRVGPK